jgi:hypothetical protein
MELHAVEPPRPILHRRDRRPGSRRCRHEASGSGRDGIPMAHPHLLALRQAFEQERTAGGDEVGLAVFGAPGVGDLTVEGGRHELMAITNTQDRDAQFEDGGIDPIGVLGIDRRRATRKDDPGRLRRLDLGRRDVAGDDRRVDVGFPHSAGDQLGVLGTEVDDENRLSRPRGHRHPIPTCWLRCSDLPSVWRLGASITSAFWNSLTSE